MGFLQQLLPERWSRGRYFQSSLCIFGMELHRLYLEAAPVSKWHHALPGSGLAWLSSLQSGSDRTADCQQWLAAVYSVPDPSVKANCHLESEHQITVIFEYFWFSPCRKAMNKWIIGHDRHMAYARHTVDNCLIPRLLLGTVQERLCIKERHPIQTPLSLGRSWRCTSQCLCSHPVLSQALWMQCYRDFYSSGWIQLSTWSKTFAESCFSEIHAKWRCELLRTEIQPG